MTDRTTMPQPEPACFAEIPGDVSPFIIEFFMVEGVGFRCMAYCDADGKWRNALTHDELSGEIRLLE